MNVVAVSDLHLLLHAASPGDLLTNAVRQKAPWLPCFLAEADDVPAGPRPYHSGSVLAHTARCMNQVAGDALAVWMAMVHDAGKLSTPIAMWPHHYGHEDRGATLADIWAKELGLSQAYARAGHIAALLHMKAGRYSRLRPGKKYDLLHSVAESGFFRVFWLVVDADTKSDISATATADWQRVSALPEEDVEPEISRQRRIALLTKSSTVTRP